MLGRPVRGDLPSGCSGLIPEDNSVLAEEEPLFPYGTYWMRLFAGVRVAAAP